MGTRPSQDGGLRYRGSLPSHDSWSNVVSQRPLGASSQGPQQLCAFGENSPNVCARLLDPFAPLNSIPSLFFNHSLPLLHIKEFVYLLNQQRPWRLTVPWWGTCQPGHRLSHMAPQLSNTTSAWPLKSIASQRKGHRGSLRETEFF